MIRSTITILSTASLSFAATIWEEAPNALASASWDDWAYAAPPNMTGMGSQGAAQTTSGLLITTSELTTNVTVAHNFIGGLGGNPDTYYFHNGGAEWTASLSLDADVTFVRVSYSLLGFDNSAPEDFTLTPDIAGATVISRGSYNTPSNTVFFTDLQLAAPSSQVETTFGDDTSGMFMGSFRSVDGVRLEVFNATPIPEPSSLALLTACALGVLRRKR